MNFYDLPIVTYERERKPDGWSRRVPKTVTIKDILHTWDINDQNDTSELTQVLRHLKNACEISAPLHGDVVRLPRMPYGSFVVDKHRTEWANGFLYALEVVKAELNAAGVAWKDENDDE